jgi:hypothetical protein
VVEEPPFGRSRTSAPRLQLCGDEARADFVPVERAEASA